MPQKQGEGFILLRHFKFFPIFLDAIENGSGFVNFCELRNVMTAGVYFAIQSNCAFLFFN